MAEFTGERVIPGQVDADLWNEHVSRYAFASRLSRRRNVLDIGCGTGYGALELKRYAQRITAVDIAGEALECARAAEAEESKHVEWVQASATALPFSPDTFQLIVAFEVIEHLADWRAMLVETRRLLAPGGQFVVSTPNKKYYAESRKASGPNPFHHHEFEFDEFCNELLAIFPHVSLFTQNHAEGIVFHPVTSGPGGTDTLIETGESLPAEAHFFIAVCTSDPQTAAPGFVYIPRAGNVLREREQHIARLEAELEMKNAWLTRAHEEHQSLVALHRDQKLELEHSNSWAADLNAKLQSAGTRILELQDEVAANQAAATQRIAELEAAHASAVQWARNTDDELARCVELLDRAEKTVIERTNWAQSLDAEKQALVAKISTSSWHKLGRALGVGPGLQDR